VVPLFEMVYRDCMAMYGKYGYDVSQAAEYVLHHIAIGRPLHYHSIPSHLYWKSDADSQRPGPLGIHPAVSEVRTTGARQFQVSYRWQVEKDPSKDYRVFVHFTDQAGNIKFQNDHEPALPSSQWRPGKIEQGPFTVGIPDGLKGTFHIRMGLFDPGSGQRARLAGAPDGDRSQLVGKLLVKDDQVQFEPTREADPTTVGDAALYTRADGGWADGLHILDRFVKNTYEILSPLNELTSRTRLTHHSFLKPDRKVQRSVFGESPNEIQVVVNAGSSEHRRRSKLGGEVVLPPYGFLVESRDFVAFCSTSWNGVRYPTPALFTLRSLDGKPLEFSGKVRVYHGFGDPRIKVGANAAKVAREAEVAWR
jgi:hypothetical protein